MIECLRYLYDVGSYARDFDPSRPAFGILLVGNAHFLSRGGRAERAAFEALITRCALEVTLDRPSRDEIHDLAQSIFPEDQALRNALADHGESHGNLRVMGTAVAVARQFAGDNQLSFAHLQKAFLFTAGCKA